MFPTFLSKYLKLSTSPCGTYTFQSKNVYDLQIPSWFTIGILRITRISRVFCSSKVIKQFRTIPVPYFIALHDRVTFQHPSDTLLFSAHINSFAKNSFLYILQFIHKKQYFCSISANYFFLSKLKNSKIWNIKFYFHPQMLFYYSSHSHIFSYSYPHNSLTILSKAFVSHAGI